MKPYIFGDRNGIYIIDLKQTLIELDRVYSFVHDLAAKGETLLFVGTKKQAQEAVSTNAERCGMPYVNARWLGGMLTNFVTIRSRVTHMEDLEAMEADGRMAALPKKEQILLRKKLAKLQANLNGVRSMKSVPQAVFVIDTKREEIAIHEAHRLNIPVIGVLDTNADPDEVDFGIPANDDAIRSVALLCEVIADAVIAGTAAAAVSEAEMTDTDTATSDAAAPDVSATASATDDATGATVAASSPESEAAPSAAAEAPVVSEEAPGAPVAPGSDAADDAASASQPAEEEAASPQAEATAPAADPAVE
jgi:small subunit ribosomal protein S2